MTSEITIGQLNVQPIDVGSNVTFSVTVFDRRLTKTSFSYALSGAPYGAYLDPATGVFNWIPNTAGIYTFYVWVMDNTDNTIQAFQQVSITVNAPLANFGYDLFKSSRALLDARLYLTRTGQIPLLGPAQAGQSQYSSYLQLPQASPSSNPLFGNPLALGIGGQQTTGSGSFIPPVNPFGNNGPGQFNGLNLSPFGQGSQTSSPNLYLPGSTQGLTNQLGQGINQLGQGQTNGFGNLGNQNVLGQSGPNGINAQNLSNGPQQSSQTQNGFLGQGQQYNGSIGQQAAQGTQNGQNNNAAQNSIGINAPNSNQYGQPTQNPMQGTFTPFTQPNPFASLQNQYVSGSQLNGVPTSANGQTFDVLRYIVSPWEQLGANVYVPYPDRYQLGPGDMLTVKISSPTVETQDFDIKLDTQGMVTIPADNVRLVLRGKTLADAEKLLKARIREVLKGAELTLSLKELRTMTVTIAGDAYLPGEYQMPAVATLFNTLYVCGGPSDNGSLRKIELRHNDGTKQTFDLYDYLVAGKKTLDVPLQPGDVIWFAPAQNRIKIKGEVPRPAVYESLPTDSLKELVSYAGGPKATGVAQRVYVETEDPGHGHVIKDVDLTNPQGPVKVFDGDTATVLSIREDPLNDLTLNGDVDQPGTYQFVGGETVADLIGKARGLRPDAYTTRADLLRLNPDKSTTLIPIDLPKALARDPGANVVLMPHDTLKVYAISDTQWMDVRQVTAEGDVQKPQVYSRHDGERVSDLILESGGLMPDAFTDFAYLKRTNPDGTEGPVVKVSLKRLIAGDASQNLPLQNKDIFTVQSLTEAHYVPDESVSILGAIQAPGNYANHSNMTLADLLQEAGGTLPNVGSHVEITHARVPDGSPRIKFPVADVLAGGPSARYVMQDGDLVTFPADYRIDLEGPRKVIIIGEVARPGAYAVSRNDHIADVVARAGGLEPDAFSAGAQFYRDPTKLVTETQSILTPRLQSVFALVTADEYTRALAASAVTKAQFFSTLNTAGTGIPIPGLGATTTGGSSTPVPAAVWDTPSVTPARPLTAEDLTPVGNISIRLNTALARPKSSDNLLVADGDIIVVPRTPTTVSVIGAVVVPSAIKFVPGHNVNYFIDRAGGFVLDSAKDSVIIIRAGGLVQKARNSTIVNLGDQIYVPSAVTAVKFSNKLAETAELTKNITAAAIIFAILHAIL
ncbi:MAG TPA: SLBB domain-containing protein [Fimbriimonadaceae bacterium]